jgi:hypothetical protein
VFDQPARVLPPANPNGTITVMTDDTYICVTAIGPVRSHEVCGEALAFKLNPGATRLMALVDAMSAMSK